ncbi:MAG: helix-turn-helix domain-containing protein [Candidatus Bathyarchaeia archaeon]
MIRIHLGRLLADRKIRRVDLSEQTGISENALSNLYHEKTDRIKFDTLNKICTALNCSLCDLLEYVPDAEGKQAEHH